MRVQTSLAAVFACFAVITFAMIPASPALAERDNSEKPSAVWPELRAALFDETPLVESRGVLTLDAPYRAHEPSTVPIEITIDPPDGRRVTGLTLVVDENPAPLAATFTFHEAMGTRIALSTNVRVNAYSNVRAIAALDDGTLVHTARFVKATGGCAAPASKAAADATASLGRINLRHFGASDTLSSGPREAELMIRHPNNSGFQVDQVTQLYIPAFFIDQITVTQGAKPVFTMVGGISLSEDPSIRFDYLDSGTGPLEVIAGDTDGGVYRGAFPVSSGS